MEPVRQNEEIIAGEGQAGRAHVAYIDPGIVILLREKIIAVGKIRVRVDRLERA